MNDNAATPQDPIYSELVQEDESFADIVVEFVNGLSGRLTKMEEALNQSDFDALRTAAHQLKGSGGGYGYPILTHHAAQLETHAKTKAMQDCLDAFEELQRIASRVVVGP